MVASQPPLREYFRLSKDLYCELTAEGVFTFVNATWTTLLGWSTDELVGSRFVDWLHLHDIEPSVTVYANPPSDPNLKFRNRYRHRDGTYRTLEWSGSVGPGGNKLFAHARDITDSVRDRSILVNIAAAREAYLSARGDRSKLFNSLLKSILAVSDCVEGFVGEIRIDSRGKASFLPHAYTGASWSDTWEKQTAATIETISSTNRAELTSNLLVIPLFHAGEMVGLFGLLCESQILGAAMLESLNPFIETVAVVVGRHAAEAKVLQNSKMASLGEMSAGVSHEINNPLAIIHGSAFRALKWLEDHAPSNQKSIHEDLMRISSNCDRIARIVRGLGAFARNVDHEPFALTPLRVAVDDVLDLACERLRHRNIELIINLEYDGLIECRSVQLTQALMNLINNAYDAVMSQDERKIWVSSQRVGSEVLIAVEDSGPGVPEAIRDRILEPFFTTKEIGKGTGLGLSISKGIIESHNGRFGLDPTARRTRFVIELPIQQPVVPPRRPAPAAEI